MPTSFTPIQQRQSEFLVTLTRLANASAISVDSKGNLVAQSALGAIASLPSSLIASDQAQKCLIEFKIIEFLIKGKKWMGKEDIALVNDLAEKAGLFLNHHQKNSEHRLLRRLINLITDEVFFGNPHTIEEYQELHRAYATQYQRLLPPYEAQIQATYEAFRKLYSDDEDTPPQHDGAASSGSGYDESSHDAEGEASAHQRPSSQPSIPREKPATSQPAAKNAIEVERILQETFEKEQNVKRNLQLKKIALGIIGVAAVGALAYYSYDFLANRTIWPFSSGQTPSVPDILPPASQTPSVPDSLPPASQTPSVPDSTLPPSPPVGQTPSVLENNDLSNTSVVPPPPSAGVDAETTTSADAHVVGGEGWSLNSIITSIIGVAGIGLAAYFRNRGGSTKKQGGVGAVAMPGMSDLQQRQKVGNAQSTSSVQPRSIVYNVGGKDVDAEEYSNALQARCEGIQAQTRQEIETYQQEVETFKGFLEQPQDNFDQVDLILRFNVILEKIQTKIRELAENEGSVPSPLHEVWADELNTLKTETMEFIQAKDFTSAKACREQLGLFIDKMREQLADQPNNEQCIAVIDQASGFIAEIDPYLDNDQATDHENLIQMLEDELNSVINSYNVQEMSEFRKKVIEVKNLLNESPNSQTENQISRLNAILTKINKEIDKLPPDLSSSEGSLSTEGSSRGSSPVPSGYSLPLSPPFSPDQNRESHPPINTKSKQKLKKWREEGSNNGDDLGSAFAPLNLQIHAPEEKQQENKLEVPSGRPRPLTMGVRKTPSHPSVHSPNPDKIDSPLLARNGEIDASRPLDEFERKFQAAREKSPLKCQVKLDHDLVSDVVAFAYDVKPAENLSEMKNGVDKLENLCNRTLQLFEKVITLDEDPSNDDDQLPLLNTPQAQGDTSSLIRSGSIPPAPPPMPSANFPTPPPIPLPLPGSQGISRTVSVKQVISQEQKALKRRSQQHQICLKPTLENAEKVRELEIIFNYNSSLLQKLGEKNDNNRAVYEDIEFRIIETNQQLVDLKNNGSELCEAKELRGFFANIPSRELIILYAQVSGEELNPQFENIKENWKILLDQDTSNRSTKTKITSKVVCNQSSLNELIETKEALITYKDSCDLMSEESLIKYRNELNKFQEIFGRSNRDQISSDILERFVSELKIFQEELNGSREKLMISRERTINAYKEEFQGWERVANVSEKAKILLQKTITEQLDVNVEKAENPRLTVDVSAILSRRNKLNKIDESEKTQRTSQSSSTEGSLESSMRNSVLLRRQSLAPEDDIPTTPPDSPE